jgi:Methyltransferase domain
MAEMEAVAQPDSVPIVHWETGRFPGHAVPGLLEIDSERARQAREFWDRAGVTDHIELVEGDAHKTIPGLSGPFDLLFIDAAKGQYREYIGWWSRCCRSAPCS